MYERREAHWRCAAAAAAVPLLYSADAFEIQRSSGWSCPSLCSRWHASIIRTRSHTEAPFLAVTKQRPRSAATVMPWLPQSKAYDVIRAHSSSNSSRQHSKDEKEQ